MILSEEGYAMDFDEIEVPVLWISEFDPKSAHEFFMNFCSLQSNSNVHSIFVYIDSFGGAVDSMATIAELVENSEKPVGTVVVGKAMSAGAILSSIGGDGMRWVGPNSRMMFHRLSAGILGDVKEMETYTREIIRMNELWLKKAVKRSKLTWKEFNEVLNKKGGNWYMSPREAVKNGFADQIGLPILGEVRQLRLNVK